jgi:hypothetical protein
VGLAALAAVLVACSGGHTVQPSAADRDCTAVTQAANAIQLLSGGSPSAADVQRTSAAASGLTTAAANATTGVAAPAGQLAAAARSYASALSAHNVEGANIAGGLLRQRAQAVANICKTQVLGAAPQPPSN